MNKPFIAITLNNNQIDKVMYCGENNRDNELNKIDVYNFIIQNHIKIHYLDKFHVVTNDPRIINRYKPAKITQPKYSKKVSRKNKYSYKSIIASTVVIATIISAMSLITNAEGTKTNQSNQQPIAYEQTIPQTQITSIKEDPEITNIAEENENYINVDYEYRTGNQKHQYVIDNYAVIAEKMASTYGLDKNLVLAIITQENAYNQTDCYAKGVMCIEPIWFGENISAYNHIIKKMETVTIDQEKLINPEYAIKIGCMILANEYKMVCNNFPQLDDKTKILASIVAYNKGCGSINKLLTKYQEDFDRHISETNGGDNYYYQHVLSYLKDGEEISFTNKNGEIISTVVDNVTTNTFKR